MGAGVLKHLSPEGAGLEVLLDLEGREVGRLLRMPLEAHAVLIDLVVSHLRQQVQLQQ